MLEVSAWKCAPCSRIPLLDFKRTFRPFLGSLSEDSCKFCFGKARLNEVELDPLLEE